MCEAKKKDKPERYEMKILDVLYKEAILDDLKSHDKKSVLDELVAPVARIAGINHENILRVLMERERLGSTGIGDGIGIPHGKLKGPRIIGSRLRTEPQRYRFRIHGWPANLHFFPSDNTGKFDRPSFEATCPYFQDPQK